ncbi:MAG: twitching motility protein PilT [Hormoscilla sp.]
MEVYVVDSHALLWFLTGKQKLSPVARQILNRAEVGEVMVFVPTIVLAKLDNIVRQKNLEITLFEMIDKAKEGKVLDIAKLEKEEIKIEKLIDIIEQSDGFAIAAFDLTVFQTMLRLPQN